jgi:hypothetical protein
MPSPAETFDLARLAQPASRMDAGMVAAMTPAERFAERRKRCQKP